MKDEKRSTISGLFIIGSIAIVSITGLLLQLESPYRRTQIAEPSFDYEAYRAHILNSLDECTVCNGLREQLAGTQPKE